MVEKNFGNMRIRFISVVLMLMIITGCHPDNVPDINSIPVNITAERFDEDLFNIKTTDISPGVSSLQKKYGDFFDLFAYQITTLGSRDTHLMEEKFHGFTTDTNFRAIYNDCEKIYADFSEENKQLTNAFRYYSYYFPAKNIPRVITIISGFSFPVICDSTNLAVSLDMYLGASNKFYSTLEPPLPMYLRRRREKVFLVADAMKGWINSDYELDETNSNMMQQMVSLGRTLFFLDKVLPEANDTVKSGYTKRQLQWCLANEKQVWSFFIENKLLFSIDPNLINKFVNDGPTTNGFPPDSPGNIGQFIGWQIVKSFMKNHPEETLQQLMEEKDLLKLFRESGYKPAR